KYAGVPASCVVVERDLLCALEAGCALLGDGARLFVLPTYTAMLDLRDRLARQGRVRGFWRE
ncbi:MAG: DUF1727 domain-containing protein, partial [Candidatus Rokubacteria bacterium]|nr:DUF1727 domain-containing protein [Candidatus Rokubacteria bacterium]